MTSIQKIKQLEKIYKIKVKKNKRLLVTRNITMDNQLVDNEGYILNKKKIRQIKAEELEVYKQNGMVVYLTTYQEPKIRSIN